MRGHHGDGGGQEAEGFRQVSDSDSCCAPPVYLLSARKLSHILPLKRMRPVPSHLTSDAGSSLLLPAPSSLTPTPSRQQGRHSAYIIQPSTWRLGSPLLKLGVLRSYLLSGTGFSLLAVLLVGCAGMGIRRTFFWGGIILRSPMQYEKMYIL